MKKKLLAGLAVGVMMFGMSGVASANLITNGSFEKASDTDTYGFTTLSSGSTAIDGWKVTSGSVDWIKNLWDAADGLRSLDMSGAAPGTIASTTFATEANKVYNVSFAMAGNTAGLPVEKKLEVTVGPPITINTFTFDTTGKHYLTNMGWETKTFSFTANSNLTTLSFGDISLGSNFYGAALDNVIVEAASFPEPASMLLMGTGLV
jgi:choice-of-anchor C domain-containing protein